MKILHIASFNGNIGDHANHNGFRKSMAKYIKKELQFTDLEIREFYRSWNMRAFDDKFVEYVNQFDLLVFGGGNYLEMCWDYSDTGCTINLSDNILDRINCPILFNGLGLDDKNGNVNKNNIVKMGHFLKRLTSSDQCLVTLRNDGSKQIAEKYFEKAITDKIYVIPDGGFFVEPRSYDHVEIPANYKVIGINVAGDSPEVRFSLDGSDGRITFLQFLDECADFINQMLTFDEKIFFIFVPHIIKDYEMISKLSAKIEDRFLRTRVSVAPYVSGNITDGDYIFDLYRKVMLTIGMRYHSNICSIAVNTPTVGIVNFEKHKMLYEDIHMKDRVVASDLPGFSKLLFNKTIETLNDMEEKKKENRNLLNRLNQDNANYFKRINEFLDKNNL